MHKKKFILVLFLLNFLVPVDAENIQCNDIRATDLLLGHWLSQNDKTIMSESWQAIDQLNRSGIGTTIKKGETKPPFVESLRIVDMSDNIFFIAKTPQNQFPVAFKLVECTEQSITFENRQHDFPNVLQYIKISASNLLAKVSGNDGKGFEIHYELQPEVNNIDRVQEYIDAYNRKDLIRMMSIASEDIQWMSVNEQNISIETKDKAELIAALKSHFSRQGQSFSEMTGIVGAGQFVTGLEKASRQSSQGAHSQCSAVVYEFAENKIKNVWYYPATKCDSN